MKKLSLLEVKQALWDERFRNIFPEYKEEINEFLHNPGCSCNIDLYKKLMQHKDRLGTYFPTREIVTPQEELDQLSKSNLKVINCHIDELEANLKKISKNKGKYRQLAIGRWQDQVTVIVEEGELLF